MTIYYVDDGGSNTSPYDTWAKAAPDLKTLDAAISFASGDIVYVGHDSVCGATSFSLTGPSSNPPMKIISATSGSSPVAYQAGAEIGTANSYLTIYGAVRFVGMTLAGTSSSYPIYIPTNTDETVILDHCTVRPAGGAQLDIEPVPPSRIIIRDLHINLTNDGTTNRSGSVFYNSRLGLELDGLTFTNAAYRTGSVFPAAVNGFASGADFSGFTNGTLCELIDPGTNWFDLRNSKTAATWAAFTSSRPLATARHRLVNVGPAHAPTSLIERVYQADLVSTTAIYRTGGAEVDGTATAWLITTESTCSEAMPYSTPWLIGTVATTGSKTFTVYVTNDTADLTDAECWLEVEYLGTSGSAQSSLASDQRASPTATAAAQTDDTTSTWNGTGPSFTYKQKLAVTVTVGQAGQYRARVVVGKASIASSAYFYVDPEVTVS